jgi:phosphate transport system substrate-binding protein
MPKLESSSGLGKDSFFTIRISKRTALEIVIAICIILGFVVLRQYEKSGGSALANQPTNKNILPVQPSAPANNAAESTRRQNTPQEQAHKNTYTPEFGADDLSNGPPQNYADQAEPQNQSEPNVSSAEAAPVNAAYSYPQAYAPSDPPPSLPDPVPAEPERNAPDNRRDNAHEPAADRSNDSPTSALESNSLNGAGATFPNAIYQKWFSEFHELHPQVQINYQSIGSGGGIKQLQSGTVDFAATDTPMTDEQLARTPEKVVHIPTVLSAVVVAYNVPGIQAGLRFSPDVLADIFLGKIRTWNDPRIQQNNPRLRLPDALITVVHRSDGNGVTYVFTDYLSKVSPEWANLVRSGATVDWPVGLGGKGNEGVAGTMKQTEGSIGYVEMVYAYTNKLSVADIKNSAGQFVTPKLESVKAAADSTRIPDDFRISITNPPGINAYPIVSYTWIVLPLEWRDANKKKAFLEFMTWMVDRGEAMAPELRFVPLPKVVSAKIREKIRSM